MNLITIYSGEKASTKDWPRTIEIKGRVRLDAFEKFLHDLHKSRSRSVMVHQHFPLILLDFTSSIYWGIWLTCFFV